MDGSPELEGVSTRPLVAKIFDQHDDPTVLAAIVGAMKHAYDHGINCPMPLETRRGELVASFHGHVCAPSDKTQGGATRDVMVSSGGALAEERDGVPLSKKRRVKSSLCDEGNYCQVYMMTGLPGQPFSSLMERTDYLRFCLGHQMGLLCKVLQVSAGCVWYH